MNSGSAGLQIVLDPPSRCRLVLWSGERGIPAVTMTVLGTDRDQEGPCCPVVPASATRGSGTGHQDRRHIWKEVVTATLKCCWKINPISACRCPQCLAHGQCSVARMTLIRTNHKKKASYHFSRLLPRGLDITDLSGRPWQWRTAEVNHPRYMWEEAEGS